MEKRPDHLSDLERRLAACEPAIDGLNADAMLFAAGRAAARSGRARFIWPASTCFLTILVLALGLWLREEQAERQSLARQLQQQSPMPSPPEMLSLPSDVVANESRAGDEPSPESYRVAHRALEHGLDAWLPRAFVPAGASDTPYASPIVFRVGMRDGRIDP